MEGWLGKALTPFDLAKFQALADGGQVSTVMFQSLNHEFRIDSEYYKKNIIDRISILEKGHKDNLGNLVNFIIGPFGSTVTVDQYVNNSEYMYVRNKDINDFLIKDNEPALIPQAIYDSLPKYHIRENDLLITVVGTLGKVAIATSKDTKSIFSCKSTIIRTKSINPFYLLTYLNSDTGKLFSIRGKRGAIQEGLNLSDLKEIQVFTPSHNFQSLIEKTVRQSFFDTKESTTLYQQAQDILLAELGLDGREPPHQLWWEKDYSDTVEAGRIDSEYYQPKYDEIIKAIKSYSGGADTLGNLCELVGHPSNPPYAEDDNPNKTFIVSQKHLGEYSLSDDYWKDEESKYTTKEFLEKNRQYILQKNDLVLYTVGGPPHIGKANIVFDTKIKSTIGSFVTLVRAKQEKINPFYLLALFNSSIGSQLTHRFQRGMVQQYIYPKDLVKTIIPILPEHKQLEIQEKIEKSFCLRERSKTLLEKAKRAVEIAIEQDETAAIKSLNSET